MVRVGRDLKGHLDAFSSDKTSEFGILLCPHRAAEDGYSVG